MDQLKYQKYLYKNNLKSCSLIGGNTHTKLFNFGDVGKNMRVNNIFSALFKYVFDDQIDDDVSQYMRRLESTLKNKRCIYVIDYANIIGIMKIEGSQKSHDIQKTIYNFLKTKLEAGHIIIIVHKPIQNLDISMLFDEKSFVKSLENYVNKKLFVMVINFDLVDSKGLSNATDDVLYWLINIALYYFASNLNPNYIHQLYFLSNDKQKINKEVEYYEELSFDNVSFYNIEQNIVSHEDFRNEEDKLIKVYMEHAFKEFVKFFKSSEINEYELRNKYHKKVYFERVVEDCQEENFAKAFYTYVYYIQMYIFGKDSSLKQENLVKILRYPGYKYTNNNYTGIEPVTELKSLLKDYDFEKEQNTQLTKKINQLEEKIRGFEAKLRESSTFDDTSSDAA